MIHTILLYLHDDLPRGSQIQLRRGKERELKKRIVKLIFMQAVTSPAQTSWSETWPQNTPGKRGGGVTHRKRADSITGSHWSGMSNTTKTSPLNYTTLWRSLQHLLHKNYNFCVCVCVPIWACVLSQAAKSGSLAGSLHSLRQWVSTTAQ